MNILITGGTGLIGQQLIKSLSQCSVITVLTRDISTAEKTLTCKVALIDKLTLADIEKQDAVINLAGEPIADKRWSKSQKEAICHSRWKITEQITEFINIAKNPPSLFISGSAIGIYGRQTHCAIDESFTDHHQEFTHEVCATWERLALAAESESTRVVLLRTGIVLDKRAGALAKMLLPFKLGLGGKIASGQQIMSWIHIEDMIAAILHILKTPELTGPVNLTAKFPVTNEVFSQTLASTLNRPSFLFTPAIVLKIIFGEMADLLLFGQNVIPEKLNRSGFTFKYPTIDLALKNLLK
ncbi:TIGR01777 family oxidoreductase [Colwelliaceae bacterium 6441]